MIALCIFALRAVCVGVGIDAAAVGLKGIVYINRSIDHAILHDRSFYGVDVAAVNPMPGFEFDERYIGGAGSGVVFCVGNIGFIGDAGFAEGLQFHIVVIGPVASIKMTGIA